jgi:hypothetical protein
MNLNFIEKMFKLTNRKEEKMIETKYIVVKTNNGNYSNVENNQTFDSYHIAMEYRDKKREIEMIEKSGYYFNVASFNIIKKNDVKIK